VTNTQPLRIWTCRDSLECLRMLLASSRQHCYIGATGYPYRIMLNLIAFGTFTLVTLFTCHSHRALFYCLVIELPLILYCAVSYSSSIHCALKFPLDHTTPGLHEPTASPLRVSSQNSSSLPNRTWLTGSPMLDL
jgi:hypothetical protein